MSLLPILLSDVLDEFESPSGILDRHYGMSLSPEELFEYRSPRCSDVLLYRPVRKLHGKRYTPYETRLVNKSKGGASVIKADKDKFHLTLDVQHFAPDEISVKVVDNNVVVEGKHEEKEDDQGWISRQFLRRYMVPSQCDIEQVRSSLSSDGILTITAPRKDAPPIENRERVIEIKRTGKPAVMQENEMSEKQIGGQVQEEQRRKKDEIAVEKKKTIAAA
ncbi:protein lethal(2)essential for life-like [Neodiprion lecontei]|uniref:Protein lethal(2)essential for life-like n=1 Tax=Neodiprion lecontei TaxID=441921 RepID=A0A6J0BUK8_NEOLC|nr:protein lethal(2)essential for life-like [Neodiprion lecontei]